MEEILINKSEKIMKEEEKSKKSSKKLIIVIAVIIVIAAIAFAFYQGIFPLPTGLAVGETVNQNSANENSASPQSPVQQPTFTTTGTEVIVKEVTENLPYYESVDLEPGMYVIEFTSDVPVWTYVFNELHFNEWKRGAHPLILAGTACCDDQYKTTSYTETFPFRNQGTKAYVVVEGAEKASIKFKITQTLKFE